MFVLDGLIVVIWCREFECEYGLKVMFIIVLIVSVLV